MSRAEQDAAATGDGWRYSMQHATKQLVVYLDKQDAWRWVLYSAQCKRLDASETSYPDKRDCLQNARTRSPDTPIYNCSEGRWEGLLL